jgi:hypothetical protein
MTLNEAEILSLCERFHTRARALGRKAKESRSSADLIRHAAMAAGLQWAAQELSLAARRASGATPRACSDTCPPAHPGESCGSQEPVS